MDNLLDPLCISICTKQCLKITDTMYYYKICFFFNYCYRYLVPKYFIVYIYMRYYIPSNLI